ncbi:MAG TPA: hypothetical protein VJ793_11655 [Anaerolineae bacterium]|nr:hypothetical protein [Anaerolineae bacterium]
MSDMVAQKVDTGYRLIVTAELTPDEEEGGFTVYCPELDIYTMQKSFASGDAITVPVPVHRGTVRSIETLCSA